MYTLLYISALLVAENQDLFSVEARHAAEQCRVVPEEAITVEFTPVGEHMLNVVKRVGTLGMAGQFGGSPGTEARLDLFAQGVDLRMEPAQLLTGILIVTRLGFEMLDLLLDALELFLRFRWGFHSVLSAPMVNQSRARCRVHKDLPRG